MSLEQLTEVLIRIADNLERNNKNHSILNEDLLTTTPPPTCIEDKVAAELYVETGILMLLESTINKIDYLTEVNNQNINRTLQLIKHDRAELVQQKGY